MKDTAGIVLAGVHKWDQWGFDALLPRTLMPVAHAPLICHTLGWLRGANIRSATVCGNNVLSQMRRTLADGAALGIDLTYYEDWMPRGPAGCVRDAAAYMDADRLVVVDGTIVPIECDLHMMLERHARSGAAMTVMAARDPDSSNGTQEQLVPVGIYVFDRSVVEHISESGYQDVKEVLLPRLHDQGVPTRVHVLPAPCPRVTDVTSYLAVNAWALVRLSRDGRTPPGYRRVGQSVVHDSAHVPSPRSLAGPVLIGPATTIAPRATVIGPTAIGTECIIEREALVSRSVLWDQCQVSRGAIVERCLLSDSTRVGDGDSLFHVARATEQNSRRPPLAAPLSESPSVAAREHRRTSPKEMVDAAADSWAGIASP